MSSNVVAIGSHPIPKKTRESKSCVKRQPKSKELTLAEYFGPGTWYSLHSTALAADNGRVRKSTFKEYANLLASEFPCADCRKHYNSMLEELRIPKSRFFDWTVRIHNRVNTRLTQKTGIKKCIMSTSEAKAHIESIKLGYTPEGSICTECRDSNIKTDQ